MARMAPTTVQTTTDPAKPSHDFFGLTDGAIGCFPKSTPTAYPPMSEKTVTRTKKTIRRCPSGSASRSEANPAIRHG
jgi:hypothetical protein